VKITLCKDFEFEAAQALTSFPEGHKCRRLHGHTFRITISVTGEVDPKTGILYDHALISEAMEPVLAVLDHAYLNEVPGLEIPSIEHICRWVWLRLAPTLPGLSEILLHETSRSRCIYRGD